MTAREYLEEMAGRARRVLVQAPPAARVEPPAPVDPVLAATTASSEDDPRELVVDANGQPRQAGASQAEGAWIVSRRKVFEENLYEFAKAILGLKRLTPTLHQPVCDWLQRVPPYRKLLLMPRDTYKSTIVSKALPIHIHIQPQDANVYVANRLGRNLRVLLACETDTKAKSHVSWCARRWESTSLLRAFWPECAWEVARRQATKWNESEFVLPRTEDYSESSMTAIGVGGTITGYHGDVFIRDDLTTFDAANSPTVMQTAIDWHVASRAMADDPNTMLEWTIGTKWTMNDLPQHIMDNDPTVESTVYAIRMNGRSILPSDGEGRPLFTEQTINDLERDEGILFYFMRMNSVSVPQVSDFDTALLRPFTLRDGAVTFEDDERDAVLAYKLEAPAPVVELPRGTRLTRDTWQAIYKPGEGLRLRCN